MKEILFDKSRFECLLRGAEHSERLRFYLDLRNTPEDNTQRILNALLPGTVVPIHRHETAEIVIILKGNITEVFFDEEGNEITRHELCQAKDTLGIVVPENTWHTVIVHEPSITFESKDGKYKPNMEICPFEDKYKR